MTQSLLIKGAKAIITCNEKDEVFYDSDLLIEGPAVKAIGKNLAVPPQAKIIDAHNFFVYPGLINTHHHFFQTFVRNMRNIDYPNMTVPDWIAEIYKIFQLIDDDVIYYSSLTAFADLIRHGCTCAFDHQYCYTDKTGKRPVDRQMEAAKLLGIRYHAGRGVNTLPASAGGSVPAVMVETTEEYLQDCQRLIDLYHDPKPYSMSQIVMSPCQPINCYPETFTETLKMARQNGVRMHTHLGEGENEIMEKRWGMRTLNWLEKLGFVGDDIWIAHGWELTKDEYAYLGQHGMGISHCIGPAVLGGFPILPLKQLQQQNVCVSLGCDGSSTNDSSSMLDSLRLAWTMQAFFSKTRGGCISPYEMLKIATVNGAKTLGRQDLGQLTPGYGADMFMIDTAKLSLCGTLHDPSNLLARVGVTEETAMTIINGKIVWQNGQFAGIDEQATITAANEVWKRVLYDKCEAYHFD